MSTTTFKVGDKVKANGFNGSVVEVCTGDLDGMLIVGLPGGQCPLAWRSTTNTTGGANHAARNRERIES